jgi:hypothetical protein
MENDKIITFIITDREDKGFVNNIYRADYIIGYGNGVVLHEPKFLMSILSHVVETFRFRVLIHLGHQDRQDNVGLMHLSTLQGYLNSDDLVLISREMDLFPDNAESANWNGMKVYNTNQINNKKFIDNLKVITISDIAKPSLNKKIKIDKAIMPNQLIDFAILTALSGDEYSAFRNKISVNSSSTEESSNFIMGKFNKIPSAKNDYLKKILIYRQTQIGMVEASICTNKIIHEHNPKFILMGGVCGGRKGRVNRYDIIIPRQVIEFTTGKLENGETCTYDYTSKTRIDLHTWLSESERIRRIKKNMFSLIPSSEKKYESICGRIEVKFDDLACVPWVIKTNEWLEEHAKKYDEKIIGLEMESYGVNRSYDLNTDKLFAALVVKSVMDFTDDQKVDADQMTGENYKETAGYMSYLCIRALMPILLEYYEIQRNISEHL